MTQFGLYSDFKMTPQEVNRVANLPGWTTVLEVMIKSWRADLAFRTTKQEWLNQRAQDRQAYQDFLEENRGTDKFSVKYAPQPQQTELIWTMPWGCWVELEDKDVHCKEWECIIENHTEEDTDTTVHQIYGQRATLSVNYKPGDWESVQAWILRSGSGWHQAETAEDPQNMNKFAAGSLERSQRTASSGYSRVDQRWSKCDSGSKRCKLSRLLTLGPRGSPRYQHFKSLKQRKEA